MLTVDGDQQDGGPLVKDDGTIGAQIRDLRRRRGLTQEDLAAKAGLSRDVIKKIESGGSARMSTYHAIARALGVVTLTFAAPQSPEPVPAAHNDAALAEIRSAINPPTGIDGQPLFKFNGDTEPDLGMLRDAVRTVALAYHGDRYDTVAELAPAVVRSAHQHVAALDGDQQAEARRLRSDALGAIGRYLIQIREHDLALMALRDSLADALAIEDKSLAAAAISSQAWALMRQGRFREVEDLCVAAADRVEPQISKATPDQLSAWGWLMLRAAAAAARNNRPAEAREYHRVAVAAAAPLGREHEHTVGWRAWGPLTVALKGPEHELVMGAPDQALALAEQLPVGVGRTMPSDWHRHLLDRAHAHLQLGDTDRATEILTRLRVQAPVWLRYQQTAREITEDLLAAAKRMPSEQQRDLADFLAVTP